MRCRRRFPGLVLITVGIGLILGSVIPCGFLYGLLLAGLGGWLLFGC